MGRQTLEADSTIKFQTFTLKLSSQICYRSLAALLQLKPSKRVIISREMLLVLKMNLAKTVREENGVQRSFCPTIY